MEDKSLSEERDNQGEFILTLTADQVTNAATRLGHDVPCTTCKNNDWALATFDGIPCIINNPLVNNAGLAMWLFSFVCRHCGTVKHVDSAAIAADVVRQEPST